MTKFTGWKRTTHTYNTAYKHLDAAEPVGTFHELSASKRDYGPDTESSWYGESWARHFRIKAPAGASLEDIRAAMWDIYEYSCCCEHDCCGHVSSRVRKVQRIRRREYRVTVGYSINC